MAIARDQDVPDGGEANSGSSRALALRLAARTEPGAAGRPHPGQAPERYAQTESSVRPDPQPAAIRTSFSDFDATLIKESFARVMADPRRAMEYFYARLFVQNPQIRALFPHAMTRTRTTVFQALARLVRSIDDPQECERLLRQLACDHRKFGVKEKHCQPFFDALLATAEHVSGPAWTAAQDAAWRAAAGHFAAVMRAAAAQDAAEQPAWWVGEIVQHDQRTATIAVITIRPDKPLSYVPGQHVAVQVPRWPRIWRSYSIANAPRDNGLLDIHVRAVPGGTLSTALVGQCGAGDTLVLGAARGDMRVTNDADRDLVCIAGGTGLAPLKAMIESVIGATRHGRRRAITLYLGVRRQQDLYDMRDLQTLQLGYPSLTLIPVAEQELDSSGLTARLPQVVNRHLSFRDTDVYISGPEGMVRATAAALSTRVPAQCLHHDPLDELLAASGSAAAQYLSR